MAVHSGILTWKIPRTEEPGRLQSMQSQRVGHNSTTNRHVSSTEKCLFQSSAHFLLGFFFFTFYSILLTYS